MIRRASHVVLAIWLAVGASLQAPSLATANHTAACSESTAVHRFRSKGSVPTVAPTGVRGTTEGQTLDICTHATDDDRSNHVWVAIDDNGGHKHDLIQAGRIKCEGSQGACDQTNRKFWAWGRNNSVSECNGFSNIPPIAQSLGPWTSGTDEFIVARDGTDWEVFIDGVLEVSLPQASICWTKKRALWAGETWDIGDAMGGMAGNKFALTGARCQTTLGGSWINPGFAVNGACSQTPPPPPSIEPPYFCVTPASDSMSIWSEH